MLSYQHQYHAGNFADVHKHLVLMLLFESLKRKEKPFCYIDCHAGSGCYDLRAEAAKKNSEHINGIEKIWCQYQKDELTKAYIDGVAAINNGDNLHYYPGSPWLAGQWMRQQDRAILMELHPQAQQELRKYFSGDNRYSLHARDCYEGLPALVPPEIKRGLVFFDPSYEVKNEYTEVVSLLKVAHQKWSTPIYAIWYPILAAGKHQQLLRSLEKSGIKKILISEVKVCSEEEVTGMYGSGMVIINAPWELDKAIEKLMPGIGNTLAVGQHEVKTIWLVEE